MSLKLFKRKANDIIRPSTKVYRKQIIEGFSIPAIIHNDSYFFVDIDVYENGRVQCWNFEDFENFKKDVKRGWVALNIPDGRNISIHGLGSWTIKRGSWTFDKDSFIDYVQALIKELNPKLENLYSFSEKVKNGVRIGENGNGTIYKEHKKRANDFFPEKINGDSLNLFYKTTIENVYYLVKVNVFADGCLQIARLENPLDLDMELLEKYMEDSILVTSIPAEAVVYIYGLGHFSIQNPIAVTEAKDKLMEIKDVQKQLKGEPTSLEVCKQAHQNYLNNPTLANKEDLKATYENIPEHQRMYVGDMDVKDIEVRMIIYGYEEIKNWSHYIMSKEIGEELPVIHIPKPKDEN